MNHELVFETSSSATANTLLNTIIYLKIIKYLNISLRQIYSTNLELKIRVQKVEDQMLYYGCKDLGLLCWKLKMCFYFLKADNGLCRTLADSNYF